MADKQYGLSAKQIELLKDQAARRLVNRQYFLKESYNPHRHASPHCEPVFDPALQRFQSMQVSHLDHFKPNPKTTFLALAMFVVPLGLMIWATMAERKGRLDLYKTGQVAYRDRTFKLI